MSRTFTPSPEQSAFLSWVSDGTGSCVLEAVAGAGKTTTLVEAVRLMRGEVFLGAYNTKMGAELKGRLSGIENARAGTFHSAGFSALRFALRHLKQDLRPDGGRTVDDKKVRDLADTYFAEESDRPAADGEIAALCQLVSLAKQTGFYVRGLVEQVRPSYWAELISRHDVADRLPDDYNSADLIPIANGLLLRSNALRDRVDFDDMVYLPLLMNLRFWPKDWVLIDEAQDTNAVRREMARRMLKPGTGRLVAVGDPHQAIFGFTGADNQSLSLIRQLFSACTLSLSVSWRCPQAVVRVAREYVDHICAAPTAPEGVVRSVAYRDMLASVSPGQAVLCRFNAPLVELCFRLIREGKPAKIEGRSVGEGLVALVGRWKVRTLDALEGRLNKWNDRERAKIAQAPRPDEAKLARHDDKYDTIVCLLARARDLKMTTVAEMQEMVLSMFADVGASPTTIVLSSVHKSKGLEWPVVHILGRGEIMPSKMAKQEWQMEQEINLCYVAVTRAQEVLVDVRMPTDADRRRQTPEEKAREEARLAKAQAAVVAEAGRILAREGGE